ATTERAIEALGSVLAASAPAVVRIFLDRPVSNSGRLRRLMGDIASRAGWPWEIVLADNPDRELVTSGWIVASGDAAVLDRCRSWVALAAAAVAACAPAAWIVDL